MKINKLIMYTGGLLSALLCASIANADSYMECKLLDPTTEPSPNFFQRPLPDIQPIIFYWGYQPTSKVIGLPAMFTSLGNYGLNTGLPFSDPKMIEVNFIHSRKSRACMFGKSDVDLTDRFRFEFFKDNQWILSIYQDSKTIGYNSKPLIFKVECSTSNKIPDQVLKLERVENPLKQAICDYTTADQEEPVPIVADPIVPAPKGLTITCSPLSQLEVPIPPIAWSYQGNTEPEILKSIRVPSFIFDQSNIKVSTVTNGILTYLYVSKITSANTSQSWSLESLNKNNPLGKNSKWKFSGTIGGTTVKDFEFGNCRVEKDTSSTTDTKTK